MSSSLCMFFIKGNQRDVFLNAETKDLIACVCLHESLVSFTQQNNRDSVISLSVRKVRDAIVLLRIYLHMFDNIYEIKIIFSRLIFFLVCRVYRVAKTSASSCNAAALRPRLGWTMHFRNTMHRQCLSDLIPLNNGTSANSNYRSSSQLQTATLYGSNQEANRPCRRLCWLYLQDANGWVSDARVRIKK